MPLVSGHRANKHPPRMVGHLPEPDGYEREWEAAFRRDSIPESLFRDSLGRLAKISATCLGD